MSKPLALTSDQYLAVCQAAEPLAPGDRSRFYNEVAAILRSQVELGDGTVNAAIRTLQGRYFRPPEIAANKVVHRTPRGAPIP
jgi:hypothetical protein